MLARSRAFSDKIVLALMAQMSGTTMSNVYRALLDSMARSSVSRAMVYRMSVVETMTHCVQFRELVAHGKPLDS